MSLIDILSQKQTKIYCREFVVHRQFPLSLAYTRVRGEIDDVLQYVLLAPKSVYFMLENLPHMLF